MLKYFDKIDMYCQGKIINKYDMNYRNCYPINHYSKSTDTAERWAKGYGNKCNPYIKKGMKNLFNGGRIVELDYRGNGGRAYKIIINKENDYYIIDIREDDVMDIIKNVGIKAGGYIECDLCFIQEYSQTKLIRVGSKSHQKAMKNIDNGKPLKKIKKFKIGGIYENKKEDKFLYLGDYYVPRFCDQKSLKIEKIEKIKLFMTVNYHKNEINNLINSYIISENSDYMFEIKKNISVYNNNLVIEIKDINKVIDTIKKYFENSINDRYSRDYHYYYSNLQKKLRFMYLSKDKDINIDQNFISKF
ncbi:MAG: hypothetical protein ACOCP8_01765 [archaeon]